MSAIADTFEDGHSDTEGAAGSHTRTFSKSTATKPKISNAEKFASSMPPKKSAASATTGTTATTSATKKPAEDFEDGHSDTEGGAGEYRAKKVVGEASTAGDEGVVAQATAVAGQAAETVKQVVGQAVSAIDPRADDDAAVRRRGSINQ